MTPPGTSKTTYVEDQQRPRTIAAATPLSFEPAEAVAGESGYNSVRPQTKGKGGDLPSAYAARGASAWQAKAPNEPYAWRLRAGQNRGRCAQGVGPSSHESTVPPKSPPHVKAHGEDPREHKMRKACLVSRRWFRPRPTMASWAQRCPAPRGPRAGGVQHGVIPRSNRQPKREIERQICGVPLKPPWTKACSNK